MGNSVVFHNFTPEQREGLGLAPFSLPSLAPEAPMSDDDLPRIDVTVAVRAFRNKNQGTKQYLDLMEALCKRARSLGKDLEDKDTKAKQVKEICAREAGRCVLCAKKKESEQDDCYFCVACEVFEMNKP